jgi:hypothetical protein
MILAPEDRVGHNICVEGSLKLIDKIAGRDPSEDLAVRPGEVRVTGPTPLASLLGDVYDCHAPILRRNLSWGNAVPC